MVRFAPVALAAVLSVASLGVPTGHAAFTGTTFVRRPHAAIASGTIRHAGPTLSMAATDPFAGLVDKMGLADKISGAATRITETEAKVTGVATKISETEAMAVQTGARETISVLDSINAFFDSLTSDAVDALPTETVKEIVASAIKAANDVSLQLDSSVMSNAALSPIYATVKEKLAEISPSLTSELTGLPPAVGLIASAGITYGIISAALSFGKPPPPSRPYPLGKYDAASARAYFDVRPGEVIARGVQVGAMSAKFGLGLLSDYLGKKLSENADQRAAELTTLLTQLGPSFIKIGQSLSIRTDILSPAYVRGLKQLQDQVPPFPTSEAREIIEEELGRPLDSVFSDFSAEPVAAASLGQVYRARLREDDREVAIKVQRPDIMNQIALDMHLIREIAPWVKRTFNANTDLVGTVDAWGVGFVDELDYISEARNAEEFSEVIETTALAGVVFAPPVIEECTTGKVLTTEWVIGERLDKSSKDDVTILCSIAMNTYLTMMLETGTLHCDPHPGNLLRTEDGRLCILDWGMVTKLNPDLQITLIEHMAHLVSADYDEIPRDLLLLGFIPESKADLIGDSGIVEVLADIYGAWSGGGGAAAINVNKVISQLQDLTEKKGNLFQIPPYFAYIAKSFSVLEGIGLSNDEQYSIINECLPYVSKRLLTDESERTGGALSTFIFGPEKGNIETRIVDYDRVEQLITGFSDYSTSASGANIGEDKPRTVLVEELSEQILDLLASEEETPLQTIFIEQLAKIITSSSRSIWTDLRERSGRLPSGRTVLGTLVDPLGLFRTSPVVRMNELDEKTVDTTRNLISLLQEQFQASDNPAFDASTLSNQEIIELSNVLINKVWERRMGIMKSSNRLAMKLLQLTADKLEKGERDILVLPTGTDDNDNAQDDAGVRRSDGRIHADGTTRTSSERMRSARKILDIVKTDNTETSRLKSARNILAAVERGDSVFVGDIPESAMDDNANAPEVDVVEPYPLQ